MDYKEKVIALLKDDSLTPKQKAALERLFPELKESEDERIRNHIVNFLKNYNNGNYYRPKEKDMASWVAWVAWLERQKSTKTYSEAWREMRLEVYAQASGNRHEPNYSDNSTKMFSLNDIDEIFEKIADARIDQKPIEWSEEDDDMLETIIINVTELQDRFRDRFGEKYGRAEKCIRWLKSLKQRIAS